MAQLAKLEVEAKVKSSPHLIHHHFKNNLCHFVNLFPSFKHVESIEGEKGCVGNVTLFKYDLGGLKTMKLKITAIDDVERSVCYEGIEGDVLKLYKIFKSKITVTSDGCAKWCLEYEKFNESVPAPYNYAVLVKEMTIALDTYLQTS